MRFSNDAIQRIRSSVRYTEEQRRDLNGPSSSPVRRGGGRAILVKVTAIHNNYVEAQPWTQAPDESDPPRYEWALDTSVTLNVALPPDLQLQFYEDADLTDPLDGGVSLTFEAGDTPQDRVVTNDDDEEETQRIVPWLSIDTTNAPPVLIIPMKMWVPNDDDDEDIACTHMLAGPHMWSKFTTES